ADLLPSASKPVTKTSLDQDATVASCMALLKAQDQPRNHYNRYGVQKLLRDQHVEMLYDMLEDFPKSFVTLDASRPWMMYWALNSLAMLGEDVTRYRRRCIATISPMQNVTGGFGGGFGQFSHAAPSYATVLTLALVGGADAYDLIDRTAFWHWAASLKQPDGGFSMAVGGEEDIRALGFVKFTDGLAEYISRCQTFEGGISGSPGTEAHGAYAFCGLACLSIMGPPQTMFSRYLDLPLLIDWLSSKQLAPEGGFAGRTNKLVDGCYSHWAGGCWPLIEAAVRGESKKVENADDSGAGKGLFDKQGLTRWILNCCQETRWGLLRDKVGKPPDAYHTNYNLAGLAGMQWRSLYSVTDSISESSEVSEEEVPYRWKCEMVQRDDQIFGNDITLDDVEGLQVVWEDKDRLNPIHPVFVIGHDAALDMRRYFEKLPFH
ncbi:CAAX farnesyltransferase (FTase) subunit beta, partial [Ascosphaera aggregata]